MACRICRRPNHNARSCKKKSRKLQRKKFTRKRRNPALLDSTRDLDLDYQYNPALLDSMRDMDLSYSYNPDLDDAPTGVWEPDIWNQDTEILAPEQAVDYRAVKQVILEANWDQIARILSGQQMYYMKKRALMKVLQNDPNVDLAIRRFIDAVNSASDDAMIFG